MPSVRRHEQTARPTICAGPMTRMVARLLARVVRLVWPEPRPDPTGAHPILFLCAATTLAASVLRAAAHAQSPSIPERARQHALAWRANLDTIPELTCTYRVRTMRADTVDDARAHRVAPCLTFPDCGYAHLEEQGIVHIRAPYFMQILRTDEGTRMAFLRSGYKLRLRAYKPREDGSFGIAVLAKPGGPGWDMWHESPNTPHRLLTMSHTLSGRVDCEILADLADYPPHVMVEAVRVTEGVDFFGRRCDAVSVVTSGTDGSQVDIYTSYFDNDTAGLLWGRAIQTPGTKAVVVVTSIRRLTEGRWYPTSAIQMFLGRDGKLAYDGHVDVMEVTRLDEAAPPIDAFRIRIHGEVWLANLGTDAWVPARDQWVRVDKLVSFAAEKEREWEGIKGSLQLAGRVKGLAPRSAADPSPGRQQVHPVRISQRRWAIYALAGSAIVAVVVVLLGAVRLFRRS